MSTVTVDIYDRSVAAQNPVNIAVVNQPNPALGVTIDGKQCYQLIQISKYFIKNSSTGEPINGTNFYDYFPEMNPGGGGGGGTTYQSGDGIDIDTSTTPDTISVAIGDGLEFDANGAVAATGGGGTVDAYTKAETDALLSSLEDSFVGMTAVDVESYWNYGNMIVGVVNIATQETTNFNTLADAKTYITNNPSVQCELIITPACTEKITTSGYFKELTNIVKATIDANIFQDDPSIGYSFFEKCSGLTTVTMTDSITTIPNGTFASCTSLSAFICPSELLTIGQGVFSNCTSMTQFEFNDKLTTIGSGAFGNIPATNNVTIPGTVTTIPGGAFMNCGFDEVTFAEGVTTIQSGAMTGGNTGTTIIRIPSTVTTVGPSAFGGVSSVQEVIINKPSGSFDTSTWGFANSPTITYTGGN